jgi:hypothetical protein
MVRKINYVLNLFVCQSANWQCIVEAEDYETAATMAVEKIMLASKDEHYCLSAVIVVKKITNNLLDSQESYETISYYSPIILANAGFHVEANNLHLNLEKETNEFDNE